MCEFRFRLANRKSKLAELNSCQVSGGTVEGLKGTQVPCLIDWMCACMIGHKGSNRLPLAKSAPTSSARLSRRKSSIGLSRWAPVICAEIFCIEDTCVAATCRTTKFTLNQACFPGNTAGLLLEMAESGFNHFAGTSLRELPFLLNSCEDTGSMEALFVQVHGEELMTGGSFLHLDISPVSSTCFVVTVAVAVLCLPVHAGSVLDIWVGGRGGRTGRGTKPFPAYKVHRSKV